MGVKSRFTGKGGLPIVPLASRERCRAVRIRLITGGASNTEPAAHRDSSSADYRRVNGSRLPGALRYRKMENTKMKKQIKTAKELGQVFREVRKQTGLSAAQLNQEIAKSERHQPRGKKKTLTKLEKFHREAAKLSERSRLQVARNLENLAAEARAMNTGREPMVKVELPADTMRAVQAEALLRWITPDEFVQRLIVSESIGAQLKELCKAIDVAKEATGMSTGQLIRVAATWLPECARNEKAEADKRRATA